MIPEILSHPWMKQKEMENETYMDKDECFNPMQADIADINTVKVDQLFYKEKSMSKMSYGDYCYIANDFYTQHIDEGALKKLERFGYPRSMVIESLHKGDLNHAIATYNLLVMP